MRVVSVRGRRPADWLADPLNIYVGRRIYLRAGQAAGQSWPQHPLANPYTPNNSEDPIEEYRARLESSPSLLKLVTSLSPTATLGCWCINAEESEIACEGQERCHAEIIVNIWRKQRT